MKVRVWLVRVWMVLLGISWVPARAQTAKRASLSREATTILSQRCIECHGREPLTAGLDLRTRAGALKGAQHGPVIVPGDAAASRLVAGQ